MFIHRQDTDRGRETRRTKTNPIASDRRPVICRGPCAKTQRLKRNGRVLYVGAAGRGARASDVPQRIPAIAIIIGRAESSDEITKLFRLMSGECDINQR